MTDRTAASRFADNAALSIPAAGFLAAALAMLSYDFAGPVAALVGHFSLGFVRGVSIAIAAALLVRRGAGMPMAVGLGAMLGALAGLLGGQVAVDEPMLLAAGAGVVVAALVQLLARIPADEALPTLLLSGTFFLIITSFWVLKTIKKGLFVSWHRAQPLRIGSIELSAAGAEQLAKVGNMVLAVLAMVAFSWLSRRVQRERLVAGLALVFAVVFLGLRAIMSATATSSVWAVYLGGDLFNTVMVTSFFAFLNDSVGPEQAKRGYPIVVFGGVFGGALGSTTVRSLQRALGDSTLVLGCAFACLAIAGLAWFAARRLGAAAPVSEPPATAPSERVTAAAGGSPALSGARLVRGSPYLLAIVTLVGVYEFCSATLDYQWTATQVLRLEGEAAIRAHTSTVYAITTWLAMLVQLLVTGTVLRRFGVGVALLVLPAMFLGASTLFLAWPVLWVSALLSVSDNSLNYSLNQSAREALWVATSRFERYQAKAFIDMFVQRLGKVGAVGLALLFDVLGPDWARWLTLPVLALLLLWITFARRAGREFHARTGSA